MVLESILNPIFMPLLGLGELWAIIIISLILAVIITIAYKYLTDQELMKTLKQDMKSLQKEVKALKHDPKKMMATQKKAMEKNMKYMMHSMKPTLITFIPLIIIFSWLNAHMAYYPINPGQEFTTTIEFEENAYGEAEIIVPEGLEVLSETIKEVEEGRIKWTLKGVEGDYLIEYTFQGKKYEKDVLITSEREYKTPLKKIKDNFVKIITIDNEKVKPLNLFGWKIGWLGTYIIFSLIFSMGLRKVLKLH
jgi:uncharacterized membrane protein (DUF106 family)